MVLALADPTKPVEFLILFFYNAIASEGVLGLLKTGLVTALVVFPFIWFAKVYVIPKIKAKPIPKLFWASVIMSLIAVVIIRVWYLTGGASLIPDAVALVWGFIVLTIGTFLLTVVGGWMHKRLMVMWPTYEWISIFAVDYVICTVVWGLAWVNILISS